MLFFQTMVYKLIILLYLTGDDKVTNKVQKANSTWPITNVHLIPSIGVALLNTQNQLRNRDKSLKVAVDFKNDFFDNLEIKHSLCNETGSEISAAETKAVIKRSQELYKELIQSTYRNTTTVGLLWKLVLIRWYTTSWLWENLQTVYKWNCDSQQCEYI